jgi:hypothetical protein
VEQSGEVEEDLVATGTLRVSEILSTEMDPGRRITGFDSLKERTVDSIPFEQLPPSRIRGIFPSSSCKTAEASVGLIRPKRFALGAARG